MIVSFFRSAHLLAFLTHAKSHSLCFGTQADQARYADDRWLSWGSWRLLSFLDRHIDQTVLLKLALRVEVCNQESSLLVSLRDLCHQLYVKRLSEVLNVLLKI